MNTTIYTQDTKFDYSLEETIFDVCKNEEEVLFDVGSARYEEKKLGFIFNAKEEPFYLEDFLEKQQLITRRKSMSTEEETETVFDLEELRSNERNKTHEKHTQPPDKIVNKEKKIKKEVILFLFIPRIPYINKNPRLIKEIPLRVFPSKDIKVGDKLLIKPFLDKLKEERIFLLTEKFKIIKKGGENIFYITPVFFDFEKYHTNSVEGIN